MHLPSDRDDPEMHLLGVREGPEARANMGARHWRMAERAE
jgi:hypothetical protein